MKCGWGRRQYLRELKNITTELFLVRANTGGFEKGVELFTALTQDFEAFDWNSTL
jgi:hypothetical protein